MANILIYIGNDVNHAIGSLALSVVAQFSCNLCLFIIIGLTFCKKKLVSGHTIDVTYLDFKNVFDSVLHIRLSSKLHFYGFQDPFLDWSKSFHIG